MRLKRSHKVIPWTVGMITRSWDVATQGWAKPQQNPISIKTAINSCIAGAGFQWNLNDRLVDNAGEQRSDVICWSFGPSETRTLLIDSADPRSIPLPTSPSLNWESAPLAFGVALREILHDPSSSVSFGASSQSCDVSPWYSNFARMQPNPQAVERYSKQANSTGELVLSVLRTAATSPINWASNAPRLRNRARCRETLAALVSCRAQSLRLCYSK